MSLRIILKPDQIAQWIADRNGTPVRRDSEFHITFEPSGDEKITVDDLLDEMKTRHLVMLVDQEPGQTFHKIYAHS